MELRVRDGGGRGLALGSGLLFSYSFLYGELCLELTILSLGVKFRMVAQWKELASGHGNTSPSPGFLTS